MTAMSKTNTESDIAKEITELRARLAHLETIQGNGDTMPPPGPIILLPNAAKREKLNFYRSEDHQEWSLLSNRLSAYITSQSFLITTYAISMGNMNAKWGHLFTLLFPVIVSGLGLTTSVLALPGIDGAKQVIQLWREKQDRLFEGDEMMQDFNDDRPRTLNNQKNGPTDQIHDASLRFAIITPRLFGGAWAILGILAIALHFLT